MRKHTTQDAAPADDQGVDYNALVIELDAIATRLSVSMRAFSTHWTGDAFETTEEALQAVKEGLVDATVKHFAPDVVAAAWHAEGADHAGLPTGFPLCPLLQYGSIQADLSNAWRLIDQAVDSMRGGWEAEEMRRCVVLLFGAMALLEAAEDKATQEEQNARLNAFAWKIGRAVRELETGEGLEQPPAAPLSDRDRAEGRDRQAHASRLADFADGRAESDRLARVAALELMKQTRPAPTPSIAGHEFERLATELEQASSLLTDAGCAMSGGWTMKELERCDAMVAGAKALIDQGRARLERADADYVRALQPDQDNDQAGEEGQP